MQAAVMTSLGGPEVRRMQELADHVIRNVLDLLNSLK